MGRHWLVPQGGEVEDGKATVAQCESMLRINPVALIVRAAMNDGISHTAADAAEFICIEDAPGDKTS